MAEIVHITFTQRCGLQIVFSDFGQASRLESKLDESYAYLEGYLKYPNIQYGQHK